MAWNMKVALSLFVISILSFFTYNSLLQRSKLEDSLTASDSKFGFGRYKLRKNKFVPHFLNGTIVPRGYWDNPELYEKYKSYLNKYEVPLPTQRRAVIILTNYRSGSSFFGQLFNQHDDAFYIFEPLFPLAQSHQCNRNLDLIVNITKNLTQCILPNWKRVIKEIKDMDAETLHQGNTRICINDRFCFRRNTRELCSTKHCQMFVKPEKCGSCGVVNLNLAANDCRRKSLVAIKLIRFCDVNTMKEIISEQGMDVKVLHLLRDPRGIANSRRTLSKKLNISQSMSHTCEKQARNFFTANFNPPDWLKGKYMAVRYEDVALYPFQMAKQIYKFVGLPFSKNIKEWITKNTEIADNNENEKKETLKRVRRDTTPNLELRKLLQKVATLFREKKFLELEECKKSATEFQKKAIENMLARITWRRQHLGPLPLPAKNPWSTKRNSKSIVEKWSKNLGFVMVRKIESLCTDIMEYAGYIKIGSPAEYANKSNTYLGSFYANSSAFFTSVPYLTVPNNL